MTTREKPAIASDPYVCTTTSLPPKIPAAIQAQIPQQPCTGNAPTGFVDFQLVKDHDGRHHDNTCDTTDDKCLTISNAVAVGGNPNKTSEDSVQAHREVWFLKDGPAQEHPTQPPAQAASVVFTAILQTAATFPPPAKAS